MIRRHSIVAIAALIAGQAVTGQAFGFVPGLHWFDPLSFSPGHQTVTENAIERILREDHGISDPSDTTEKVMNWLIECSGMPDKYHPEMTVWHFDAENFIGAHSSILEWRMRVAGLLRHGNPTLAREILGNILHPLQDFYAHSNWIELGNRTPIVMLNAGYPRELHGPGDVKARGAIASRLFESWSSIMAQPDEATCGPCADAPATLLDDMRCEHNLITSNLTSGYYPGQEIEMPASPRKCKHGGVGDDVTDGINKDAKVAYVSPHWFLHEEAKKLAEDATVEFIRSLKIELALPEYLQLLGIGSDSGYGPPLGVVIDTTASMQPIIDDVVNQVKSQATALASGKDRPSAFILTSFNDPVNAVTLVTDDYDDFEDELEDLEASGGGDCPEPSLTAALASANKAPVGTHLYLFTNSAAGDPWIAGPLGATLAAKQITIFGALLGSCSPFTPEFFAVAERSGGQMFVLNEDEVSQFTALSQAATLPGATHLAQQSFELEGSEQRLTFYLDPSVERVTVSVTGTTLDSMPPNPATGNDAANYQAILEEPLGHAVVVGDLGVEVIELVYSDITKIERPSSGWWTVRLNGKGHARVVVDATSQLTVQSFRLHGEEPSLMPAQYMPVVGSPIAGRDYVAVVELSAEVKELSVELLDRKGAGLGRFTLQAMGATGEAKYAGMVTVPAGPFLVRFAGKDTLGNPFVRMERATLVGQAVEVEIDERLEAVPGTKLVTEIELRNLGPRDEFNVVLFDQQGYLVSAAQSTVRIEQQASEYLHVEFEIPDDAEPMGSDEITIAVASRTDPQLSTAGFARIDLVTTLIEDADLVPQGIDNCVEIFNPNQDDVDVDGLGDACDDDIDGDEIANERDNCPSHANADQLDPDRDGMGNPCDPDPNCQCRFPGRATGSGWGFSASLIAGLLAAGWRRRVRRRNALR